MQKKNDENRFILHLVNLDYYYNYVIGRGGVIIFQTKLLRWAKDLFS